MDSSHPHLMCLRSAAIACSLAACLAACEESSAINLTGAAAVATPQSVPSGDGGGVVIEYMAQRDFGTGRGPGTQELDGTIVQVPNARQAANSFLESRELKVGPNDNGVITFIGESKIAGSPTEPGWGENRVTAASKAMLAAKRDFVQYLAAQVQNQVRNRYVSQDPFAAMADARELASRPPEELTFLEKAVLLANHELDKFMKERGATVPPDDPEARRKLEQELREKAASLCSTDEFREATEVAAQAEISGLQAFRMFESGTQGDSVPAICVVAIYSPKSAKLQMALLGKGPAPTGAPRADIGRWAKELGPSVMMYTHGCQPRTNAAGEVVLVAFGQVTPANPRADRGRAISQAVTRAYGEARKFLGEFVNSLERDTIASTVKEYADGTSVVRNEGQYVSEIETRALKLDLPGGLTEYDWEFKDPATGRMTYGVVRVYSVSEALRANKIRDMMKAAGGASGGRGLRDARAPEAGASKPSVPTGTGKSTGGAGAAGEAP
jgi:hypothetical protein